METLTNSLFEVGCLSQCDVYMLSILLLSFFKKKFFFYNFYSTMALFS